MEIANFFWHGQPLSIYENASLASFVRHGFDVNLWCYKSMAVPEGVRLRDASQILSETDTEKFTQGGRRKSLRAFANSFRYRLLASYDGWWFDIDLLCLKSSENFAAVKGERTIVCGFEDKTLINNAVLNVIEKRIADELVAELDRSGFDVPWGFLGAQLVTRTLEKLDLLHMAMPRQVFYPVHWSNFDIAFQPGRRNEAEELCQGALTYHIWNEYLTRVSMPKNILPPEGSYLHALIVDNLPEARNLAALPAETFAALLSGYILRQQTEHFFQRVHGKVPRRRLA